jgi:hypothetical protein
MSSDDENYQQKVGDVRKEKGEKSQTEESDEKMSEMVDPD